MSIKLEAGSIQSLLTTELNSLASATGNSGVGTAYDNSNTSNLYILAAFELNVTFGSAPTAGGLVDLYLIPALDGTNYDDGTSSVTPPSSHFIGSFVVRAVNTAQKIVLGVGFRGAYQLPPVPFKLLVINKTSQAFPASGSTVKMVPYRYQ